MTEQHRPAGLGCISLHPGIICTCPPDWATDSQHHLCHARAHSCLGFRWDNCCCENGEWQKANEVAELGGGREQTFYHLLVDAKDWEASWERPPVAYVAEELLQAPEVSCKKCTKCLHR